jgi:hypothetical protein
LLHPARAVGVAADITAVKDGMCACYITLCPKRYKAIHPSEMETTLNSEIIVYRGRQFVTKQDFTLFDMDAM